MEGLIGEARAHQLHVQNEVGASCFFTTAVLMQFLLLLLLLSVCVCADSMLCGCGYLDG